MGNESRDDSGVGDDEGVGLDVADPALRAMSAVGTLLFSVCFAVASLSPASLETRARSFVVDRVTREVDEFFGSVDLEIESESFGILSDRLSGRADSLRASLNAGISARLASALSSLCHYDCRSPDSLEADLSSVAEERIGVLRAASDAAMSFARGRYRETVTALVRDLRIFSGINATLFLLVLVASFGPSRVPAGSRRMLWLLLAATGVSIIGYVFVQDWFHTLLLGRYVGYGYALWVGAVFSALVDWVFNEGRAMQGILDALGGVTGAIG